MTELWTVCGIGMCMLVSLLLLRELRRDWTPLLLLGFSVVLLAYLLPKLGDAVGFIRECAALAESVQLSSQVSAIIRALGVVYLTSTASDICKSAGEAGIGSAIELAGRVEIVILCIPLFRELLNLALLGG